MSRYAGLRLANDARPISKDYWNWSVWVEGPDDALDEIESVKYTLHHTFPDPVRVVRDRASKFRLTSEGWGEFTVYAELKRGSKDHILLERWLVLEPSRPAADGPRKPRVFLSSSAVDRPLLGQIQRHLEAQGVEVMLADRMPATDSLAAACRKILSRADLGVWLISNDGTRGFAQEELRIAREVSTPVVPLLVGDAMLPDDLGSYSALNIASEHDAPVIADALAARVKDLVVEDERS